MTTPKNTLLADCASETIPDVQGSGDTRRLAIDRVGIKDIKHPVIIGDRNNQLQHTVARFNMYVHLPQQFKGTHMSRFVQILNNHEDAITVDSFKSMLQEMNVLLEAQTGHIEMSFPFFIKKSAPISGVTSLMDYEVSFIGKISQNEILIDIKVIVPVTSLCPCSKKISKYGAHNQRSHVTATINTQSFIWVEEIIDIIERTASCELYALLKRPDEKYVTEKAYENPKFVEDMVRDVAAEFNKDPRILAYTIESENFESIHNHSAYAQISHTKPT